MKYGLRVLLALRGSEIESLTNELLAQLPQSLRALLVRSKRLHFVIGSDLAVLKIYPVVLYKIVT